MENIDFYQIIVVIFAAFILLQSYWLRGSISRDSWQDFLREFRELAGATPNKIDDKVADAAEDATPFLERFGIFKDKTPHPDREYGPGVGDLLPPVEDTPVSGEPVAYEIPLAPYANRQDYKFVNDDGKTVIRQVHIPDNMSFQWDNRDSYGKRYPYPNVQMHPDYGAEFDLTHIAGRGGYGKLATLHDGVTYHVVVDYTADIKTKPEDELIGKWASWQLSILSVDGVTIDEAVHPIENGHHEHVWEIVGNGQAVTVTPELDIRFASAQGHSKLKYHTLKITPVQKKA